MVGHTSTWVRSETSIKWIVEYLAGGDSKVLISKNLSKIYNLTPLSGLSGTRGNAENDGAWIREKSDILDPEGAAHIARDE